MAEIQRKDVISDDALKAPLEFAENWAKVGTALDGIVGKLKGVEGNIQKSGSTVKVKESVQALNVEQNELMKVQKQIATLTARDTEEYRKQAKALTALKQQIKEKTALGDRDALSVNKQNASLLQLRAALNANRLAYGQLVTEEQRASAEGQKLLKVIQEQDAAVKELAGSTGDSRDNVGDYKGQMKALRDELKLTKDQLVGIAATLGTDSQEFIDASVKAGELQDRLNGVNDAAKTLSGAPFENIGNALGQVGAKLRNLDFKGAAQAGQQLVVATKAMTFKEAIAGAGQFGSTMLSLGKALLLNPIFLIASTLVGIGVSISKLKDSSPLLTKAFDAIGDAMSKVISYGKQFLDWIGITTFALDEQAEKIIDNAKKRIDATRLAADQEIKIAQASGQRIVELEIKKNKDMIKAATDGLASLFEVQKRYGGKLNEAQMEQWDEYIKVIADANTEIQSIQAAERQRELTDARKLNSYLISEEVKRNKEIVDNERATVEARINASEQLDALRRKAAQAERNTALSDDTLTASGKKAVWAKYQQDLNDITKEGIRERQKIAADEVTRYQAEVAAKIQAQKKQIMAEAEARQRSIDSDIQATKKAAIAKGIAVEEAEKIIAFKQKQYADDYVQVQIDAMEKVLKIENLSAEEQAEIQKQLYKLRMDLTDAMYAQLEKKDTKHINKLEKDLEKLQEIFGAFSDAVGNLFASITERRMQKIDEESAASEEALNKQLEREDKALKTRLATEKLTDEEKAQIEKSSAARKEALEKAEESRQMAFEQRRKREVRKQAIYEKGVALAQAAINIALAATKAASQTGVGAVVSVPLILALGAIQLAAIAARPIPAAEHGIDNHKGGPIIAGEAGQELVKTGNKWSLTDSKAALYNLPAGTKIFPHEESMRMIAMSGLTPDRENRRIDVNADIKKELRNINKTIQNKPAHIINGQIVGSQHGSVRINYLNSLRNAK